MDGPSVNLSFKKQLISMLVEKNYETAIIHLDTCALKHKVNTVLGNAVAQIHKLFGVDQFPIDVPFFL